MTPYGTLSATDILTDFVEPGRPGLSPEVAQELLSLRFNDEATTRIRDLLQKNDAETITPAEKGRLENYLRVGELLDLLQAKARHTLRQAVPVDSRTAVL
jgi:hypothetical protein